MQYDKGCCGVPFLQIRTASCSEQIIFWWKTAVGCTALRAVQDLMLTLSRIWFELHPLSHNTDTHNLVSQYGPNITCCRIIFCSYFIFCLSNLCSATVWLCSCPIVSIFIFFKMVKSRWLLEGIRKAMKKTTISKWTVQGLTPPHPWSRRHQFLTLIIQI